MFCQNEPSNLLNLAAYSPLVAGTNHDLKFILSPGRNIHISPFCTHERHVNQCTGMYDTITGPKLEFITSEEVSLEYLSRSPDPIGQPKPSESVRAQ